MNTRQQRMVEVLDRDGPGCVWCSYPLLFGDPDLTTEHLVPRVKGGPSWLENEVAACSRCNRQRRVQSPVEYAQRCLAQGLHPRPLVITRQLQALAIAIENRGGQRKARPYLARELRRAQRWLSEDGTARRDHETAG